MISNGGLAIHGGLLLGLITIIYLTKKRNIELFNLLDIISPSIILAQSIGRWGNYFNQEAYGRIISRNSLEKLHIPKFIINFL
jgi:phosphatidylglycerol:prolipoprotein diacylglycerol transferase